MARKCQSPDWLSTHSSVPAVPDSSDSLVVSNRKPECANKDGGHVDTYSGRRQSIARPRRKNIMVDGLLRLKTAL